MDLRQESNVIDGKRNLKQGDDEKHTKGYFYETTDQTIVKGSREGKYELCGRNKDAK